jgi:Zn finger protein HypA/HybF involved in hydrogenase expression
MAIDEWHGMAEEVRQVMCPDCHAVFPIPSDWRLGPCPKCGAIVTLMGEDSSYD